MNPLLIKVDETIDPAPARGQRCRTVGKPGMHFKACLNGFILVSACLVLMGKLAPKTDGATPSTGQSTVIWSDVRQRIDGFGAACAWTARSLSDSQADLFFSVDNGIGLSLLRNRLGPDGTTWELVTMLKAQARGAKVWSTPWSPNPAWKDNTNVNDGGHLLASHYQDYANQMADYVATMKSAGVNLHAISVQNEPELAVSYESGQWSAQEIHDFIPYLYDALVARGVSATKILIAESYIWKFDLTADAMNEGVRQNSS